MPCVATYVAFACALVWPCSAHAEHRTKTDTQPELTDARSPVPVTLAALLAAAVRRSPELAIARADHEEGRARERAADAIDEWHLIGRAAGSDVATDRVLAVPGVALDTRSITGELGVQRTLPTGTAVTVAAGAGQLMYTFPSLAVAGTITTLRMQIAQPILRGRSLAQDDQSVAKLEARGLSAHSVDEAAELVHQIATAYWELAYATQELAIDREAEALAVKQVAITQEVVRAGMQPPSATKLAELQVALHREAIVRDQMTVLEQSLALRRLVGLEIEAAPIAPADPTDVPVRTVDDERSVADAIAHGPSIAQKLFAQRAAIAGVDVAHSGALPRVDLTLAGELTGVGDSIGSAADRIGNTQMYSVTAGLAIQWDLGGAAAASERAARQRRARSDGERQIAENELAAAALTSAHRLASARQRVALAEVAVEVATDTLRSEIALFQAGRSTNMSVFQREDDVATAKLRLARAHIDAIEADLDLAYLTGELLPRFGIRVIGNQT